MHDPLVISGIRTLRWSGGEAVLCAGDALAGLPERPGDAFAAIFIGDRRMLAAGPGPLPSLDGDEVLLVSLDTAFLLEAAGLEWHPQLSFLGFCDAGDEVAWLMAEALRRECIERAHCPDYARRLAEIVAIRLAGRHVRIDSDQPLQGGLSGHRLRACIDHIERNLHRDIALDELAGLVGLSTPHFSRAFRRSLGEPPYRYFRRRRIERAKLLLAETDQGIAQIALECGYAAQSHFSSAFKLMTMTTPAAWRRARQST
ncbi:AraC family transcriptional regulator [Sphingomonas sp. AOB5]|uniref:helix-turn-helix domain-containing protein n=1 Tax=Sphingomonas sp. AOB5 TaxID=3034017 RepID=UPI0023F6F26D|nr:AraC family transcriptional regulator [Sphingomonas sp. AOB5]MDF7774399.1 AraC family transcriptional regulator [Sphingomonas sp. AOB5]